MRNSQLKQAPDRVDVETTDEAGSGLSGPRDAVIGIGRDQTIVFFSDSAVALFGFSRKEIVGRPANLLLPEPAPSPHHGLPPHFEGAAGQCLAPSQRRKTTGRRRDGTTFAAEVRFAKGRWQDQPVVFAMVREIAGLAHARRAPLAAHRPSERRQRAIIEASPEPILITDVESGRIAEANRAAVVLFGRPRAKELGVLVNINTDAHSTTDYVA